VDDGTRRQNYRQQISWQIERITSLVERLVLVSELETLQRLEKEPLTLQLLIGGLATELADSLAENQLTFHMEQTPMLNHCLPLSHRFFPVAIKEIIMNSIHHCPPKGEIKIKVAQENQRALIFIEDSAEPIDSETLPHIFNLFFREDKDHSTPGFGLGLPIARRVIDLHNGKIVIQPQPEVGNVVKIWLPL